MRLLPAATMLLCCVASVPGVWGEETPAAPLNDMATGNGSLTEDFLREPPPVPSPDDSVPGLPAQSGFELYEIDDPEVTQELWMLAGLEGEPEVGRYQLLMYGDGQRNMILLREGTQVGNLHGADLTELGIRIRRGAASGSGTMTRSIGARLWRNFWNPNAPLEPFQWKTGLDLETRIATSVFKNASAAVDYHRSAVLTMHPEPWLHLEGGGHMSRHGGGLHRNLYNPFDTATGWNGWDKRHYWWHIALGVPGVKWEISQAGRPYARYYWLDHEAGAGSYKLGREIAGDPLVSDTVEYRDGVVMRNWREGGDRQPERGNVAHAIHVKMGAIHYSAHFDRDVYRAPIHELFFDGLSAPFGEWGFGFVATRGTAHTRLRLDLLPLRLGFGPWLGHTSMRFFFLRLDAAYRDPQTFHLGAGASLRLDSPFLRPGETFR